MRLRTTDHPQVCPVRPAMASGGLCALRRLAGRQWPGGRGWRLPHRNGMLRLLPGRSHGLMRRDPGLVRAVPAGGCRAVAGTASHADGQGAAKLDALATAAGVQDVRRHTGLRRTGVVVGSSPTLRLCLLQFVDGVDSGAARRGAAGAGSPACSAPGQAVRPLVRFHRRGKRCPRPPALPTQLVQRLPPGCLRACDRIARPALCRKPTFGQRRPSRIDTDRNSPGPNAKGIITRG